MKKLIKITLMFSLLIVTGKVFSQVTVATESVYLNNQSTIIGCNLLDFGTVDTNSLIVYFKLSKPAAQAIGNCNVKVMFMNSSSSNPVQIGVTYIAQSGAWSSNTTIQSSITVSIPKNTIQVTGSFIYVECTTDSNLKTKGCDSPLKKTPPPSFTLYPPSLNLACGDTSTQTVGLGSANVPTGATISYIWNAPGWSGTIDPASYFVTLTPSSANNLPSSITVTPYINGVAQNPLVCPVNRTPFSTTGEINNDVICTVGTSNTYTLTGLASLSTTNTISWSSSNTSVATVTSSSNATAEITAQSQGSFQLKATITNPCGQIVVINSAPINVAMPTSQPTMLGLTASDQGYYSPAYINNLPHDWIGVNNALELTSTTITGNTVPTDWEWQNVSGRFVFSGSNVNGNSANGKSQRISFINGIIPDKIEFKCRAKSSCNWSEWKTFILNFSDGVPIPVVTPPVTPAKYFTVSPNPASSIININAGSSVPPSGAQMPPSIAVFSAYGGQAIIPKTMVQGGFTYGSLNISSLSPGYYILTIYWGTLVESHNFVKN